MNVGGLQSVLSATREHGLSRLVYTSSFLALPPADSPHPLTANHYQRTKVAARDVARRATSDGSPVVTLYPGVIYGPGPATEGNLVGRLMRDHLAGRLPGVIGPERLWSYAYVDDVADAHVAALTHPSPARDYVVGGVNAPQQAIYEFLNEARGRPLPRRLPNGVALAGGASRRRPGPRLVHRAPLLTRGVVEIFSHDWSLDSTSAQADLGLRMTPLKEGLALTLAALGVWVQDSGPAPGSDPGRLGLPGLTGLTVRSEPRYHWAWHGTNRRPQPPSNHSDAAYGRHRRRPRAGWRQRRLSGPGGPPQPGRLPAGAPDDRQSPGRRGRGAGNLPQGVPAAGPLRVARELQHVAPPDRGELLDRLDSRTEAPGGRP